ncbi:putative Mg2+ transporter-C (MgtC) family protein [Rhodovulum sp. ES.010]|uniref:MgtC/SapB family protein n=1 Tax=Rhodovulum sp. ES.010 TaxID=1882821 RepID=UPI00092AAB15|nr:MgtC/SapB family protein [Rhodovulum sp. ES.010]SIO33232.1 putative Mg2+ transporter-C (MgtC) family protein [Rhodovulum sp. ES.010]
MLETLLSEFDDPFGDLPAAIAVLRLTAATVLGGLIGLEREVRDKPAGLRTHMLIALAACLFTLIAFQLMEGLDHETPALRVDPLRLIEAVTAGVAFLAAGAIIVNRGSVRGLTTGAGMWLAGAIGLACGAGNLPLAALATAVALVVLGLLRFLE